MKRRGQQIGFEQQKVSHVTFDDSNKVFENRRIMQENYSPNQNQFSTAGSDPYSKKSNTTSLASKFSKRWEHAPEYSVLPPSQTRNQTKNSDTRSIPIENNGNQEESTTATQRNTSNQSAEIILRDIDLLLNRVHEICSKKEPETDF